MLFPDLRVFASISGGFALFSRSQLPLCRLVEESEIQQINLVAELPSDGVYC